MAKIEKVFREKIKTFYVNPFGYKVVVVVTNDLKKSIEKHTGPVEMPAGSFGAFHRGDADDFLSHVFLSFNADGVYIVHEAFHVVWRIMHRVGASHENEVMAYTLDFIFREIADFVKKTGNGLKKKVDKSL